MSNTDSGFSGKVAAIWSLAETLRGDFKSHEYGQYRKMGVFKRSEKLNLIGLRYET